MEIIKKTSPFITAWGYILLKKKKLHGDYLSVDGKLVK